MYKVRLSDSLEVLRFPQRCICCGMPADTTLFVFCEGWKGLPVRTYRKTGCDVPYCGNCAHYHLRSSRCLAYGVAAFLSFIMGIPIIGYILTETDSFEDKVIVFLLPLIWIFLTYRAMWGTIVRLRKKVGKCCLLGLPIEFHWEGDAVVPGRLYLLFRDSTYAHDFAQLNGVTVESKTNCV